MTFFPRHTVYIGSLFSRGKSFDLTINYFRTDSSTVKSFARNCVCEMRRLHMNSPTFFAFEESRTDFYSLAKRIFFSRNLICLYGACVQLFRAKYQAFIVQIVHRYLFALYSCAISKRKQQTNSLSKEIRRENDAFFWASWKGKWQYHALGLHWR